MEGIATIKADTIKKIMEGYNNTVTIDWHGEQLSINRTIGFMDIVSATESIVDNCFGADGNYIPCLRDFFERKVMVELYTNVELPEDVDTQYNVLYRTDLVDTIATHADPVQLSEFSHSVAVKLKYRLEGELSDIRVQAEKVISDISSLASTIQGALGDVSEDDIKKLIKVFSSGIDESKMMEAYMNMSKN